jgi:hypothetical protein
LSLLCRGSHAYLSRNGSELENSFLITSNELSFTFSPRLIFTFIRRSSRDIGQYGFWFFGVLKGLLKDSEFQPNDGIGEEHRVGTFLRTGSDRSELKKASCALRADRQLVNFGLDRLDYPVRKEDASRIPDLVTKKTINS